jgi:toxin CcdB
MDEKTAETLAIAAGLEKAWANHRADVLDALATRLTIPLAELDTNNTVPTLLCPVIVVNSIRLHALAHYSAPLPAKALRRPVGNVAAQASALVSAMDAVLSGV